MSLPVPVPRARDPRARAPRAPDPHVPDLRRPWRLLRTRWPWACSLYLLLEFAAGWLTFVMISTVILVPVWVWAWPRLEARLLPLAGRPVPRRSPPRGTLTWRDAVQTAITPVPAVAGIVVLSVGPVVVLMPLARIAVILNGPWRALDLAEAAGLLLASLLLAALFLWALTALARAWSLLPAILLRDDEARLAGQVAALSRHGVRTEDRIALERRRLERDLHDGAQMHLSAAGMRLALLELELESVPQPQRDALRSALAEAREQLDAASTSVRDAARGLVPATLRDGGLAAGLAERADALPLPVEAELTVGRADEAIESGLFLIASETLTNVVRHAQARSVRLRALEDSGAILLEITDDGWGGAEPSGTGLLSMAARAESLGGSLDVESPVGGPTTVRARVPRGTVA